MDRRSGRRYWQTLRGRPRPQRSYELPRGFEEAITPFGTAAIRQDIIPLPALDPHPGGIAYVDTETTGLMGGAGTYVFRTRLARTSPAAFSGWSPAASITVS